MIELIKVGNGDSEYFGNFTKQEKRIINKYLKHPVLNLFSGKSEIGLIRVDFSYGNVKSDVFDYLGYTKQKFNTIIIDAPYNQKFADKYQKIGNTPKQFIIFADVKKTNLLFEKIDKLNPEIIILKSWNYYCLKRYRRKKLFICYAGGYRRSTFLIVMEKSIKKIEEWV